MKNLLRLQVEARADEPRFEGRHELSILIDGRDVLGEAWDGVGATQMRYSESIPR
ncbi:MAG: hypothetical protein ABR511_11935 [Acidimicrobiales bacterium]